MNLADLGAFGLIAFLIMIAPYIARIAKTPIVATEILLGAIVAYIGVYKKTQTIDVLSDISFLFLMLLVGMEVDIRSFVKLGMAFYKRALVYFIMLYLFAFIIVITLNLPYIFIAIFPVMSLGMFMTLLKEYGKEKEWLSVALKIGVFGELLSIIALVLLNSAYSYDIKSWDFYRAILILLGFIVLIIGLFKASKIVFWYRPALKFWLMPSNNENNQDIRFIFMLFFVLIGIVAFLQLELVLGSFLAGIVISTFFMYKHDVMHKLNDIGSGFFVPLFFLHVGTTLDLDAIFRDPSVILHGFYIVIGMLIIRLISANVAFGKYFKNRKNTILFAISHCMPLTFLIATAALGLKLKALDEMHYYSLVIAAMAEGIIFIIVIKLINLFWKKA